MTSRRNQYQERSAPQIQAVQSSAAYLRWVVVVRAGLVCAFVLALALTAIQLDVSRDCRGGFSRGFSSGFDVRRCELVIQKIGTNPQFRIPKGAFP
jgi:hypothetical protein